MHPLVRKTAGIACAALGGWILARTMLRRSRNFSFAGKTVLVTGGSRGLGLVFARRLVAEGARVVICARTGSQLISAAKDLTLRGGEVMAFACDVRDQSQVERMVGEIESQWGSIDVLLNVAGIIEVGPLDAMTVDDFRRSIDTHCFGPLHTTLAVLPGMHRRGWGRIVNIASLGGKRAVPHMLPYGASKLRWSGSHKGCGPNWRRRTSW
ncbi:MAG: SDR family oxidoreductase [Pirellulales bacterium]